MNSWVLFSFLFEEFDCFESTYFVYGILVAELFTILLQFFRSIYRYNPN